MKEHLQQFSPISIHILKDSVFKYSSTPHPFYEKNLNTPHKEVTLLSPLGPIIMINQLKTVITIHNYQYPKQT